MRFARTGGGGDVICHRRRVSWIASADAVGFDCGARMYIKDRNPTAGGSSAPGSQVPSTDYNDRTDVTAGLRRSTHAPKERERIRRSKDLPVDSDAGARLCRLPTLNRAERPSPTYVYRRFADLDRHRHTTVVLPVPTLVN